MASFNKVILMGNLTRDPQLRYIPSSNQPVVDFGMAMNRRFKAASGEDRDETTFVDVVAFGKTAEFINQYFTKGKPILVEGRLKLDQWEDKNGGGKRSKLTVVAETVSFVGTKEGGGGGGGAGGGGGGGYDQTQPHDEYEQRAPAPRPPAQRPPAARPLAQRPASAPAPQQPPAEQAPPFDEGNSFEESDIPF